MLGEHSVWLWVGFSIFVLGMLALDLGVFHRKAHAVSLKEAAIWSTVWVTLAMIFAAIVWQYEGPETGKLFLAGYLMEKALSVDNVFVFILLFTYFKVPAMYQHRVLFWGILGALVMRATFIGMSAALLHHFEWIIYIFGAFLIYSGIKMLMHQDDDLKPEDNPVVRIFKRFMPVTEHYHGQKFFIRESGKLVATPLFIVLLLVESTDLVFAIDSIPAIFALFPDPSKPDFFIVYTSNVFAILGLRALYFLLAGVMDMFRYLKFGLSAILIFVGVKMLLLYFEKKIPINYSLSIIGSVLFVAVLFSIIANYRDKWRLPNEDMVPESDDEDADIIHVDLEDQKNQDHDRH